QNETSVAIDPFQANRVVAGFNDYRRGDGNCYASYSQDGGRSWTDSTVPMSFSRGAPFGTAREYWQAGGDPSLAWDTKGNAYFSCQVFNRGNTGPPPPTSPNPDQASGILLYRSTANGGASWNFPGRYATITTNVANNPGVLTDKPYMTVDNHRGSPYQDRIYVTWTQFAADGTAYIYEVHSSDYGETFSKPVLVSATSTLCGNTYGLPTPQGNCNENQFSDPFTGSDGNLYVVYNNYNNVLNSAQDNRNQFLLAKSTDGGASFGAPVKVSDYYDLPDCATYQGGQDNGRACVPEKGSSQNSVFRATNYAAGQVNPQDKSQVVVTFGSYINKYSNEKNGCVPTAFAPTGNNAYKGVKTAGACNNKILISVSKDAGATFTGTTTDPRQEATVNSPDQAGTDQFWQWSAFNRDGRLAVSYFDRQYGSDETTGYSDMSLSGSSGLDSFGVRRVTSSSMPTPTEFPDSRGNSLFYGDYTGVSAVSKAIPVWMDTRDPDLFICGSPPAVCGGTEPNGLVANDQDIFADTLSIPSGGQGQGNGNGGGGNGDGGNGRPA
ncbi:MAG: sialidase family protein, partial [Candidatus Dormibacteraceae bacterium]